MPNLPASVYSDLADPSKPQVVIPHGRWDMTALLQITRPVHILAYDATLVCNPTLWPTPIYANSAFLGGTRTEIHAIGVITPSTDTLTIADPTPNFVVGEMVLVRSGINYHDLAEPEFQTWAIIRTVNGSSLQFDFPFMRTATQWESYDQLVAKAGEWQRYKTGPWELRGGYYSRGLGQDHGIVRFVGGKPLSDVTIEGLHLEWPATEPAKYAQWMFSAQFTHRFKLKNIRVTNPRGSVIHLTACEDSGVDDLLIRGNGESKWYANDPTRYTAIVMSLWGGTGSYCRRLNAVGKNIVLSASEVGTVGTVFEECYLKTFLEPGVNNGIQINVAGDHPGFSFRNCRFDVPTIASSFGASHTPSTLTIENLGIDGPDVPSYLLLSGVRYTGTIRIGSRLYGPARRFSVLATISTNGQIVNLPQGLYRSCYVRLSTRTGINEITTLTKPFVQTTGTFLKCSDNIWGQVNPGSIDAYLTSRRIQFWMTAGAAPVSVIIEGDYFPASGQTSELFF